MVRIVDACDRYRGNQDRLRAFVLVTRHSGLRIGDAIALDENRLNGNKLLLYTAKTGTPVYIPLPPMVIERTFKASNQRSRSVLLDWQRQATDGACELVSVSRRPF